MSKTVSIIGVPMELGQSVSGVDKGPDAIRKAGLQRKLERLSCDIIDLGNIKIDLPPKAGKTNKEIKLKNLHEIYKNCERLAKIVDTEVSNQRFPLILGGDHSIAIGSLAGIAKHYHDLGVIWYDAHSDINSADTSPSGNIHGMPLAVNLGIGNEHLINILGYRPKIKPEHIVIVGARSIDDGEKELIKDLGIRMYTMSDVQTMGIEKVMAETIAYLHYTTDGIHLSLDVDALDPSETPGVGTPVHDGLSTLDSYEAMTMLAKAEVITSAELVEVNPLLDKEDKTVSIAVKLMELLFANNNN